MSQTYFGNDANFFYNGDFSGKIDIIYKPTSLHSVRISIDAEDILGLVAEHIKSELVGKVESMDTKKVFSLLKRM
jgi:hypothetical protein